MNKKSYFFGVTALVASQFTVVQAANAFCVEPDNFCDRLEVFIDGAGNVYGRWDWTCDGVTLAPVLGERIGPDASMAAYIGPLATTANWRLNIPARLFDLWGLSDPGTGLPFPFQLGQGWTNTGANCGFGLENPNADLPRSTD